MLRTPARLKGALGIAVKLGGNLGSGENHRGLVNSPGLFARRFVLDRVAGFEKDISICLTPTPSKTRPGKTHAYFPALGACCGMIEYLTALRTGKTGGIGSQQVVQWAEEYLPATEYGSDEVRILFEAFRHSVAHRGIASGIWVDRSPGPGHGRRVTWKVKADAIRPAIQIVAESGVLTKDPPWECRYSHRVHIHLKSLKVDIREAAKRYGSEVVENLDLQERFLRCMRQLYPQHN